MPEDSRLIKDSCQEELVHGEGPAAANGLLCQLPHELSANGPIGKHEGRRRAVEALRSRGEQGRVADVTLVWGRSLVRDAYAVSAEIEGMAVDQDPLFEDRFTLVAPDALKGYGDDYYLDIHLWSQRGREVAQESLYDIEEVDSDDVPDGGEAQGGAPDGESGDTEKR